MARVVRSVISTLPFSSTSPSRSPVSGVVVGVGETGVGSAVGSDAVGEGDAVVGSGDGSGEEVGSGDGDGEGDGDGAGTVLIQQGSERRHPTIPTDCPGDIRQRACQWSM